MGGKQGGKGKGKGQSRAGRGNTPSQLPAEDQRHAQWINHVRVSQGLATKSTGSIARSKARAMAHRQGVPEPVAAADIGEPSVRPPRPPSPPIRGRPIVLTEASPDANEARGELLLGAPTF